MWYLPKDHFRSQDQGDSYSNIYIYFFLGFVVKACGLFDKGSLHKISLHVCFVLKVDEINIFISLF